MTRPRTLKEVQGERVPLPADTVYTAGGKILHCDECDGCGFVREISGGLGLWGECELCHANIVPVDVPDAVNLQDHHSSVTTDGIRFFTVDELREMPEPEWLVEPFVPEQGIVVLFGPSGTYKSFIAIDIAGQVDGPVVYISAEGSPSRFGDRLAAWEEASGRPSGIVVHPQSVDLLTEGDAFAAALRGLPEPPRLLVVDTMARNMGGDENSTPDMSRFVRVLDQFRAEFGFAVLVIAHTGHGDVDRERGSSALRGAADVSIRCKRESTMEVKITCAKMRDAGEFEPRIIRLLEVASSLVVVEAVTRQEDLEQAVREYLDANPDASQRDVEGAVTGGNEAIRAVVRKVRQTRQNAVAHPEPSAPRKGAPKEGAPPAQLHTLDPDEWKRAVEDGGWG